MEAIPTERSMFHVGPQFQTYRIHHPKRVLDQLPLLDRLLPIIFINAFTD